MAVRIRSDSTIVCAAMHEAEPGDTYISDGLHQRLSEYGVLVSEPHEKHRHDGLWWWYDEVPIDRQPAPFYATQRKEVLCSER
jgi:hypothetical protein